VIHKKCLAAGAPECEVIKRQHGILGPWQAACPADVGPLQPDVPQQVVIGIGETCETPARHQPAEERRNGKSDGLRLDGTVQNIVAHDDILGSDDVAVGPPVRPIFCRAIYAQLYTLLYKCQWKFAPGDMRGEKAMTKNMPAEAIA
jgi:hypothetical protein